MFDFIKKLLMKKECLNNLIYKKTNFIVFFLLTLLAIQAISSMQKKNITSDEHVILPDGYTYLKTGKFFIIGHVPLMYIASSLPLFFLDLEIPPSLEHYYLKNEYKFYNDDFLYVYNKDKVDQIVFLGRIPIVLLSILLGFFVFRWAKEIYGIKAGLFALFLYSFSPNILAHSRLATTDLGYSFFMFIALYYFWKFVNNETSRNLILAGITFGLAQVSKFTALSLIPIFIILVFVFFYYKKPIKKFKDLFTKRMLKKIYVMIYSLFVIFIIGLFIINLTYYFQGSFKSLGKNLRDDKAEYFDHDVFNTKSIVDRMLPFENKGIKKIGYFVIDNLPIMVPYPYLKSLIGVSKQFSNLHGYHFFIGRDSANIWYSNIVTFLIKTPIPTMVLLLLSLLFFKKIKSKDMLNEYFLLIPILFIFIYFSFFFKLKAVLRYVLPMYPFIFVFISNIINLKTKKIKKQKWFNLILITLCGWYLFSSISIYPHYLAYFNEFVGGPDNGYNYLVTSNLDWGQDLKGLGKYIKEKNISNMSIVYYGVINPDYYNISYGCLNYWYDGIEGCTPKKGLWAISATYLRRVCQNGEICFGWLKEYEPIDKIGYSILIYNISSV